MRISKRVKERILEEGKPAILLKNAHVVDPASGINQILDIFVHGGKIVAFEKEISSASKLTRLLNRSGGYIRPLRVEVYEIHCQTLVPGLIDLHVHLREPGNPDKETIQTVSKAAIRSGFTSLLAMPNTVPPCDNPTVARYVRWKGEEAGLLRVIPAGCITVGREGKTLAPMGEMYLDGVRIFTDDGRGVSSSDVMYKALKYAKMFRATVAQHLEDESLSLSGSINEGRVSAHTGLPGQSRLAETAMLARDLAIVSELRSPYHALHLSCAESVKMIREAKRDGLPVTAEVTPHHLLLTEEEVLKKGTLVKVCPPIRTSEDREALVEGLLDGTIDIIASDHAPHTLDEKEVEFSSALSGISLLDYYVPLLLAELVATGLLPLTRFVQSLTINPARLLSGRFREPSPEEAERLVEGLDPGGSTGHLSVGEAADLAVLNTEASGAVRSDQMQSKAKQTPFEGWKTKGSFLLTLVGGEVKHNLIQPSETMIL